MAPKEEKKSGSKKAAAGEGKKRPASGREKPPEQRHAEEEEKRTRRKAEREAAATEGEHPVPADAPERDDEADETAAHSAKAPEPGAFPVVGIGASAGGSKPWRPFSKTFRLKAALPPW